MEDNIPEIHLEVCQPINRLLSDLIEMCLPRKLLNMLLQIVTSLRCELLRDK